MFHFFPLDSENMVDIITKIVPRKQLPVFCLLKFKLPWATTSFRIPRTCITTLKSSKCQAKTNLQSGTSSSASIDLNYDSSTTISDVLLLQLNGISTLLTVFPASLNQFTSIKDQYFELFLLSMVLSLPTGVLRELISYTLLTWYLKIMFLVFQLQGLMYWEFLSDKFDNILLDVESWAIVCTFYMQSFIMQPSLLINLSEMAVICLLHSFCNSA